MKKVLLSTIVGSLLLTSANANIVDRGHFGISLGSIKFENADAGASVGFISKFEKNVFGDLYFGLGTNLEIFDASNISELNISIGIFNFLAFSSISFLFSSLYLIVASAISHLFGGFLE